MSAPQNPRTAVVSGLMRLGEQLREADAAFPELAEKAARAEAYYRQARATRMLIARDEQVGRGSVALTETIADADPQVAAACLDYKVTAAMCDAARQHVRALNARIDIGRTVVATEREADRFHTQQAT